MRLWWRKHKVALEREHAPVETDTFGEREPTEFGDEVLAEHGYAIYERMLTDAHVKACFNLKRWSVLSASWRLEPASDTPEARGARVRVVQLAHDAWGRV